LKKLSFSDESFELTVAPSLAAKNNEGGMQIKKSYNISIAQARMTVDHRFPNRDNADSEHRWREVTKRQVMNTGTQYKVLSSR